SLTISSVPIPGCARRLSKKGSRSLTRKSHSLCRTIAASHQRGVDVDAPAGVKTNKPNWEEHAMESTPLSRRDMLKGTVTLAAAASVGIATTTRWRRADAQ